MDQGTPLRTRQRSRIPGQSNSGDSNSPPVIVVGSGKGGVGKSVVAISLAAAVAAAGIRVLLVDGDQNLGNLHVLLGLRPALTPEAILDGAAGVADLPIEAAPGLWLIPADSGAGTLHNLTATDRARLAARISTLYADYDLVVVDAGAGLDSAMRSAAMRATSLLIVTLPEATALTDAYALLKIVNHELPGLPIEIAVNRTRGQSEGQEAFDRISEAADRFLSRSIGYFGVIPEDTDFRDRFQQGATLLATENCGPALDAIHQLAFERIIPGLQSRIKPSL